MRSLKGTLLIVGVMLLATSGTGAAQSVWQKIKKSAKDAASNTAQQGGQAAQQGVQQGAQQVQQQIPGAAPGQANQMNPSQQPPCGSLPGGVAQGAPAGYGAPQGGYDASGAANVQNAGYTGAGSPSYSSGSCGPQCFNAGPFAAAVSQTTLSQEGGYHIIRMNMQFRNSTNQPLMIAYHDGSSVMVDNFGSTYNIPGAFGQPVVQGMGIDRGNQTDSQFTLGPGQTGNVLVTMARARNSQSAIGTGYTYNLTIDELQAQNGADAALVRQYNLNFPSITPGASNVGLPAGGASPTTNVAGGGKGKRGAAPTAPAGAVAGVPAQGVMTNANGAPAAGTALGQPGVVNATSRTVAPSQPGAIAGGGKGAAIGAAAGAPNARAAGLPVQGQPANARVGATPAQNAVTNAGLRTNAAAAARPAPPAAAKPTPAKPNAKTQQQQNQQGQPATK